jgi:hypothetical protein
MLLCVLGCIGCGGGDEDAVPKCDVLRDGVCDRVVECAPQQATTHASCLQRIQQTLSCESPRTVSATYDRCIQQVKSSACQVLFPTNPQTGQAALRMPADCTDVIQMLEPDAALAGSR